MAGTLDMAKDFQVIDNHFNNATFCKEESERSFIFFLSSVKKFNPFLYTRGPFREGAK